MKEEETILSVNKLSIGYREGNIRSELFSDISAEVIPGEIVAVVGSNGAGKSTLLRTITGLHYALKGEVIVYGQKISTYQPEKLAKRISYVAASSSVSPYLTVYELVSLGRFPHTNWIGRMTQNDRRVVEEAIESVDLGRLRDRKIGEVSDGERQRSLIARALAQDTGIVILDEPTAYLDLPNKYELISLLRKVSASAEKSFIYTTHDLHIAVGESDRIWLLGDRGFVDGAPEDLMIRGSFEGLFAGTKLQFADESGLYTYPVTSIGKVILRVDDPLRKVAERLLYRLKIDSAESGSYPVIIGKGNYERAEWKVETNTNSRAFTTLYALAQHLRKEVFYQPNFR